MSEGDTWSPDDAPDNEAYESWDEALDDEDALDPDGRGPEGERSLDSQLTVDEAEIHEAGVSLDEPERLAVLNGGMDDPDGVDPGRAEVDNGDGLETDGWDLDAEERETEASLDESDD
jgi:hypothetical protein